MDAVLSDPILDIIAARQAAETRASLEPRTLGREEFLRLLIAQLENQNPLEPAGDTEFVAQLATFSSLEQLMAANENLQALSLGQANLINSQALNLIGKEALVEAGDELRVVGGVPETLVYVVPRTAQSATLTIFDAAGVPLRVLQLETTPAGRVTLEWDGKDSDGAALADGSYRFAVSAAAPDGEPISLALFKALPIEGVNFHDTGIGLVSGDREIPFELILEIRAGQPGG
jgi:flagellar basal-body rod modification protein FlgD